MNLQSQWWPQPPQIGHTPTGTSSAYSSLSSSPEKPAVNLQSQWWPQPPQIGHKPTGTSSTQLAAQTTPVERNHKQVLNEFCQKARLPLPVYTVLSPIDSVGYVALVELNGKSFQSPVAGNKKQAQDQAAAAALQGLGLSSEREGQDSLHSTKPAPTSPSQSTSTPPPFMTAARGAQKPEQRSHLGGR